MKKDAIQAITDKFIESIEQGLLSGSWVRPWSANSMTGGYPTNYVTGRGYTGINALLLMAAGGGMFATYKQWQEKGGQVRKGEKGIAIIVPMMGKDKKSGEQKLFGFKGATVFQAHQVDGIDFNIEPQIDFNPIEAAECLLAASGADIRIGGNSAHYVPSADYIQVPRPEDHHSSEEFYSTALHELVHWTGHKSRLDRDLNTSRFGDEAYAFEELVAELGSAFLCAHTGVHQGYQDNHAKYLKGWLKALKNDPKAIVTAASQAQKALDFLVSLEQQTAAAA